MMKSKSDPFLKKLLSTFRIEAGEHIQALISGLIELEKKPPAEKQREIVETIFREAHSLKGAARSVNKVEIESICQSMENVLAGLKRNEVPLSSQLFDVVHQSINYMDQFLSTLEEGRPVNEKSDIAQLIRQLEGLLKGPGLSERYDEDVKKIETKPPMIPEKSSLMETVRISTTKLDAVLLQAEQLISTKLMAGQRAIDLRQTVSIIGSWRKKWAKIYPEVRKIRQLIETKEKPPLQNLSNLPLSKLVEFLDWNHTFIDSLEDRLVTLAKSAEHDHRSFVGILDNLLEDTKKILMLPFSLLLEILPKMVRDLSHDQGKDVELVIHGGELEIDRRILEEMKDSLIHLVRNGVDHGIETPEERMQRNKPVRGRMSIDISQKEGNKIEILISDDGAGVDSAKVRLAAQKHGLISREEAERLTEPEALSLIFRSGVSTSSIITDLSGRGLGLAIVREKVEKLGGNVSLETSLGVGTTFRILLPLTLATFRGIVVRVEEDHFVLPTIHVEQVVRVPEEEIRTVENRETIQLNGQVLSVVRLSDVLELPAKRVKAKPAENMTLVILGFALMRIAFLVDEVVHEQEVLVKSLGKQLSRVRNISGATILGTGKVVPILNVSDLMHSAVKASATTVRTSTTSQEIKAETKSILVAEDSITARTLVKNILESAGYRVKTAVDGVDAFTALKTEKFDLVVSDVDMPRMNGFDLTAKIRADQKLSEMPVVLVTALESREDREQGIDVGANAYIVKSQFDQSNLLEVIQRLI
ncbi:MAG: hybrid sensor histidine kinase/response regulator [Nitrospira sp.]|nr:hybrid sensor histidine kinase/response regulator [Nitrospira sp.]